MSFLGRSCLFHYTKNLSGEMNMQKLNLETKNKEQELVKAYLQENASKELAEKINNGVIIEKDGKRLINRKTLDGFMQYACDEARKQAEKGKNSACVQESIVYGWAIHYFEENSIEGVLFNEDGTAYKSASAPKQSAPAKPAVPPKAQPKPQMSLFDLMTEPEKPAEPVIEQPKDDTEQPAENIDDDDDEISEEEQREILAELAAEEERRSKEQRQKSAGSPMYRQYLDIQAKYPDSIVIYRLGDFYEVFGENAVKIAKELDLTLTGRDCGLDERVPMVGFPYHAADNYFRKLVDSGYKLAICETLDDVRCVGEIETSVVDTETGEIQKFGYMPEIRQEELDDILAQEREIAKAFNPEAICLLSDLLGECFILR